MKNKNPSKTAALIGVLCAQAIAVSFLESLLPHFPGFPPGAKPGFSNIVTMYAVCSLSFPCAVYIVVAKASFAGLTRGATAFFMSLTGGLLSAVIMYLLKRAKKNSLSLLGIGIAGAVSHNIGQMCVASAIIGTTALIPYIPWMIIFGIISGSVTGLLLKAIFPIIGRLSKKL